MKLAPYMAVPLAVAAALCVAVPADAAPKPLKKGAAVVMAARKWGQPAPVSSPTPSPTTTGSTTSGGSTTATPSRSTRLSDATARAMLAQNGISVYSSGNCTVRTQSNCTSLDTITAGVVYDTIQLKKRSGCKVLVTGGTETGHASGTYSHWNGYKIDINDAACLSTWIPKNGTNVAPAKYQIGTGVYWDEGNHWDIVVTS